MSPPCSSMKQLGIGSYRSAWLLAHKLRARMVFDPERNPLSGLVEIDEASNLPFDGPKTILAHRRARTQPRCGKMLIVGAIEARGRETSQAASAAGRESPPTALADLGHFVETAADPDAIRENRRLVRLRCGQRRSPFQCPHVGKTAAHLVLPWIQPSLRSNLKGWREASTTGCVARRSAGLSR